MTEILFHGPTEYREISASYAGHDWMAGLNAYRPPPTFPRSDAQRIERMDKYVDWKRAKVRQRTMIELAWVGAVLVMAPLVVALLSALWKLALNGVLG